MFTAFTARYDLKIIQANSLYISPGMPGFDPNSVYLRFVVDGGAMGQVSLPILRFFPVSIIPTMPDSDPRLHVALTRWINRRIQGTFQKAALLQKSGTIG